LRSWQPVYPERSEKSGGSDDAASIRSKTSLHSLTKKRLQAQRSFDAIATKISQHAAHPHLPNLHSSPSVASLTSLSPNASSSQISLGAATLPSSSSSITPIPTPNRRSSLSHPSLNLAKESASNPRRPSLPSVWEKAAHPRAAIRQALGMSKIGSKDDRRALAEAMASRSSLGSAMGEEFALEEEDEDALEEGPEDEKGEKEERRRSMEVHRPLRMDSFTRIDPVHSSAPPTQTSFTAADLNSLTSTTSTLRPDRSPTLSRAPSASKHELYRPRMSSQLSMGSEGDGTEERDTSKPKEEKEGGDSALETTPSRQRSVSNPQPESRSPLLQQLHQNLLEDAATNSSPFLYSASSTTPSPASSRRPSTGSTTGLADTELSSDGSSAMRTARPTPADVRRAFSIQHQEGRSRADSLASSTSSFSRPPSAPSPVQAPPLPAPVTAVQARADANRNRSDSTASSLSTNSFLGGQSNFSYAGTSSTAPTSVAPSSPGTRAEQFHLPTKSRIPSNLAPLYESKLTQASESTASTSSTLGAGGIPSAASEKDQSIGITRAQARSRVQKAERDLLSYQPSSSRAASNASSGAQSGASRISLREQLAQYGKSLAIEREVAAKEQREELERETGSGGGYRIETIGSSSKRTYSVPHRAAREALADLRFLVAVAPSSPPTKSTNSSTHSAPSGPSVPTWRAVPTVDRLMPPPAHVHSRQSSPAAASTPRRHYNLRETTTILENSPPSTKSSPAMKHQAEQNESTSSPLASERHSHHQRPSTPTSLSSSTVSGGNGGGATGAGATVLGTGIGGVQFVEVAKDPSPHHRHNHHGKHSSGNTRASERSHSDKGTSVTSVRNQVEEDKREQERRDASIPKAVLTAGGKKKGIKGWFKS